MLVLKLLSVWVWVIDMLLTWQCKSLITYQKKKKILSNFPKKFSPNNDEIIRTLAIFVKVTCMVSRVQNVRTVGGVLAITTQHQEIPSSKYTKPFTFAFIYSAEYFSKGRFEVRAAMRNVKLILAQINLWTTGKG